MRIQKILIANRGEIACRIMRTCAALGVRSVAVYSDADAGALHVELADEAWHLGQAPAAQSYLDTEKIIAAAKASGADAVHPGYGFLSENAGFADAVVRAGMIFIGPPASAMRAMGGKAAAKALMAQAGVPLVPGYHGADQDAAVLLSAAEDIGFPVLLKASAGGGGKGMRVVAARADFAQAFESAQREAQASFGDARILVEKYIARPRHVEIQVFADMAGHTVYLGDRDCSVQRRHQKVLEEAPAPFLPAAVREKMGAAAVAAAQAVGYVGAGTVEFLLDEDHNFYFMEMNTRLQVEHPVTEMVTGLDLVALQIAVAEGKPLPFTQADVVIDGHAFEARLYAEDPENGFLPGAGQIRFLSFPAEDESIRIDTGVRPHTHGRGGDVISIYYDPMIAKIIVRGVTRDDALGMLAFALDNTHVAGPKTNLSFLRRLAQHPAFAAGKISTGFIDAYRQDLLPERPENIAPETLCLATLALLKDRDALLGGAVSPWQDYTCWRVGGHDAEHFAFHAQGRDYTVGVAYAGVAEQPRLTLPDGRVVHAVYAGTSRDLGFTATLDGQMFVAGAVRAGDSLAVMYEGCYAELVYKDPLAFDAAADASGPARLTAPMPGRVVAVPVRVGDAVKKGDALVVVEAMKMEHTVKAPFDGVIAAVYVAVGDQVDEKREMVRF